MGRAEFYSRRPGVVERFRLVDEIVRITGEGEFVQQFIRNQPRGAFCVLLARQGLQPF